MKFDYVIGNPPYQEEAKDTSDKPIYHHFMDAAFNMADDVILIHPARFLFNAGKTPKAWNDKMLSDEHLKVLHYEQDSSKLFANTDIKGGIAITYHDAKRNFGAIGLFSSFSELNSISMKVREYGFLPLSDIVNVQTKINLDRLYEDFPELRSKIGSKGKERRMTTSIFSLPVFHTTKISPTDIEIIGLQGSNERTSRFIDRRYVDGGNNLYAYKVILPKSNGSGAIGEVLSTPLIGEPLIGYTQTFISIGTFGTQTEVANALKYIKSKFSRLMLGILKITQDNNKDTWRMVPLQDFTPASDIDWTKSVADIDGQLYAKYGLSEEEIAFIETKVKEMV